MKPNELLRSLSWTEKKAYVQPVGKLVDAGIPGDQAYELGTLLEKMHTELIFDGDDLLRWDSSALWLITNAGYSQIAVKVG